MFDWLVNPRVAAPAAGYPDCVFRYMGSDGLLYTIKDTRGLAATKLMKLDAAQQKRLLRLYQQGEPVSELTSMFGISRSTLFRTLKVLKKREPVSA
jgi:DNA invertase Pin-like site-specific DNA recombinase